MSQISTVWTALCRARDGPPDPEAQGWATLLGRYHQAAYRYLSALMRDPDAAAEVFQEFALCFLRGDFDRADPGRGRFRDYLKGSLRHLAATHRARAARHNASLIPDAIAAPEAKPDDPNDEAFLAAWRKALLDRAWEALEAEQMGGGAPHYTALRARADLPDLTSAQLADHLSEQLQPAEPFTDAGIRKLLQRARERFAELLIAEVAASFPTRDRDRVEDEVIALGFHSYCRKALESWRP